MFTFRSLIALTAVLAMAGFTSAAGAAAKPKPKHHHGVHGKVVEVHQGSSSSGSFKVQVRHHRAPKKSAAAAATKKHKKHIHEFHVSSATHFVKVVHEANGKKRHHKASFNDLKAGEHVVVHAGKSHDAKRVAIETHGKKKTAPKSLLKKKKK